MLTIVNTGMSQPLSLRTFPEVIPEIPTAITAAETEELQELARGCQVLEVGSLLGYSTVVLAQVAHRVFSVDPHGGYPTDHPRPTLPAFLQNLEDYHVLDKVVQIIGYDHWVVPSFRDKEFGLVFIDTTGTYNQTLDSAMMAWRVVAPGGHLAIHDCGHPEWPGAAAAVQQFSNYADREFRVVDRMAVFQK